MANVTHSRRQLGIIMAVLFAATLLLMGLAPQAQSQEVTQSTTAETTQSSEEQKTQKRSSDEDPKGHPVAAGELIVSYEQASPQQAMDETPKEVGGRVEEDIPDRNIQLVSFPDVKNERAQEARQLALQRKKEALERNPDVKAVDYNYESKASWTPNDLGYGQQWGYPMIHASESWDVTQGSSNVNVAVIDTGIDSSHPDLKDKIVAQRDFTWWDDSTAQDDSDNGHGTHVAGTVAATTNNGTGVAGTCPNCKLLIAKAGDASGTFYDYDVVDSIYWAADNGADVINMSFGRDDNWYSPTGSLKDSLDFAWAHGIVLVAAAGNDAHDAAHIPAVLDNVIAVAATDRNDQRASFSNFGDWIDVAAPGVGIYSTLPVAKGSYGSLNGTSMASPHVAGLAGLLASRGYSNSEIRNRIEKGAIDLIKEGPWTYIGKDKYYGYGRIDARDAFVCVPDTCSPIAKPPVKMISTYSQLGTSTVPVRLDWPSSDRGGSGIARYELQQSTNGGAFTSVMLPSAAAYNHTLNLAPNSTYRFRVKAQDSVGNWSVDWAYGSSFKVHSPYQENNPAVSYPRGPWTTSISSTASGGYLKSTSTCFANAKFSFTGSNIALVAAKGPYAGYAEVRVDGASLGRVNLSSSTIQARSIVFQKGWISPGYHTIEVIRSIDYVNPKTLYMTCDPYKGVNVDAFTVLQ